MPRADDCLSALRTDFSAQIARLARLMVFWFFDPSALPSARHSGENLRCAGTTTWPTFSGARSSRTPCPIWATGFRGKPSRAPFASPPGVGLSSAMVNVLWGLFNLAVGYLLVCRVGSFDLRKTQHAVVLGAAIVIMSLLDAHAFARLHGGL